MTMTNENSTTENSLTAKVLNISTGSRNFVFLSRSSPIVIKEGFEVMSRLELTSRGKSVYSTLYFSDDMADGKVIGIARETAKKLGIRSGSKVTVKHMEPLKSFSVVRDKLRGKPFTREGILEVIGDVVAGRYTDMHMACLCSATEGEQLSEEEIEYFARAMVETGKTLKWDYDIVVDKHCIGGIPGNRTTPPAIAIIAEYGLHIPKTSSRAITSPAGTADVMEVFTNIVVSTEEIKRIVAETNGCLVWGGAVDLNPSDDIIINVKKQLGFDSRGQMLASIISKKVAAGSTHILIDVPYGQSAKTKTLQSAKSLKRDFEELGNRLGVNVLVNISDGSQPVGNGIGPALEAKDIVALLKNEEGAPHDLREKVLYLAGLVIEFDPKVEKGKGQAIAEEILNSGKAWERFKKICEAQGNGKMKEIPEAKITYDVISPKSGVVESFDNKKLAQVARFAGCPSQWAAGIYLRKHIGDKVKAGEALYTIHSNSAGEMEMAKKMAEDGDIIAIRESFSTIV
ncbi:MAG: thymidine phosphorylase family protein [Rickettsiales bacterium]|jgi:thymidine phosphorylase|nr:thymidine phosphorylase family protein [Rickettsiales bacterium]